METDHFEEGVEHGLDATLHHLRHLLPVQGPIGVFVHHNTLHAYEHIHFETAVLEAGKRFGTEPYMSLAFYRRELARGRITRDDVEAILRQAEASFEGEEGLFQGRMPLRVFRRLLLTKALLPVDGKSARFFLEQDARDCRYLDGVDEQLKRSVIAESVAYLRERIRAHGDPLSLFADPNTDFSPAEIVARRLGVRATLESLEAALEAKSEAAAVASLLSLVSRSVAALQAPTVPGRPFVRLRDRILSAVARDTDDLVNEAMIPVLSAYLDQGLAYWPMGYRKESFYTAVRELVFDLPPFHGPLFATLRRLVREERSQGIGPETSIENSLLALGYEESERLAVLEATILALPGWAGMVSRLEEEPELAPHEAPPARLVDFIAVRLLFDRAATEVVLRDEGLSLKELPTRIPEKVLARQQRDMQIGRTFALFQLVTVAGLGTSDLGGLPPHEWARALDALDAFSEIEQRRVLHLAYERKFRREILSSIATLRRDQSPEQGTPSVPSSQVVFCIDDREESIRRHLEEVDPTVETLGAGGFFGVAMAYRGIDDGYFAALCPVVEKPGHTVRERHLPGQSRALERYQTQKKLASVLAYGSYVGTRGLVRGFVATFALGLFSLFPLMGRVLFPRKLSQLRHWVDGAFFPKPETELALQRDVEERAGLEMFPGFTPREMADRVHRVLEDTGLVGRMSRLVLIVGHGSTSLNNPYASAYDCGACGGRRGGPNARLFARMANDPAVRAELRSRGKPIPDETFFLGVYHDTCTDQIEYLDLSALPASHQPDFAAISASLESARILDAHERCRRFESATLSGSPGASLAHVEGRSENLAEPRPELGHATNAIAIFGRRSLSRSLFLDRRSFLVSYDPTRDDDGEILGRLLAAMGPVGAGINLEYYFSRVDSTRYGSGTKLPHNVVGLLGVMNGPLSDLRTGLPEQMTEIHEPVRLLVICEATPERIAKVAERQPGVKNLVFNQWVQFALVDPDTGQVTEFDGTDFVPVDARAELPSVACSSDWYSGHRQPLPPAILKAAKVSVSPEVRS